MTRFNQLTDAEDERLSLLIEECAEVIQAATKIKRHGYESVNPFASDLQTNRLELAKELGHLQHASDRLTLAGDIRVSGIVQATQRKARTIGRWLHHQDEADLPVAETTTRETKKRTAPDPS